MKNLMVSVVLFVSATAGAQDYPFVWRQAIIIAANDTTESMARTQGIERFTKQAKDVLAECRDLQGRPSQQGPNLECTKKTENFSRCLVKGAIECTVTH